MTKLSGKISGKWTNDVEIHNESLEEEAPGERDNNNISHRYEELNGHSFVVFMCRTYVRIV